MHLKSLVLKGFKSFADRSVMAFEPGISAIVGPNGSGKSNISDAVLWVLGERNARNLRGQSMEDVIFSGSSARKPQGMAEVSLVLDNSDGTLPVDFTEVSLTRRMYRDGASEYLINGTVARRMDVLDILHDSGLGTGTHSIIGQGQLSSILQSKPEDLRMLIEEAAGVLKHKQRKEKSERKLAAMDDHLTRVRDIVSEVKRQMKPLERKAKQAIEYRDAAAVLAGLELQLAVDDLRTLQGQWDKAESDEHAAQAALAAIQDSIGGKEAQAAALQEQLQGIISGAGEHSRRHARAQAALGKLDSDIMLFREKKRAAVDYLAEMRISLENDMRASQAAQSARESAAASLAQAQAAWESANLAKSRAQALLDGKRTLQRTLQQEIDGLSHRRRDVLSELEETRRLLARTREILSSNRARTELIQQQAKELEARLEQARQSSGRASARAEALRGELADAKAEEAILREESGMALRRRDESRAQAESMREASAAAGAHLRGLESAWKKRQAKNPLRALGLEIAGKLGLEASPLVGQVSVPDDLEPLLTHLLGEDVNALVVDGAHDALSIAGELDAQAPAGLLTVLYGKEEAFDPCGEGESFLDLVEAPPRVKGILSAILGDIRLFGSLSDAAAFARAGHGSICACRDGFVIWPDGKLTCFREREGSASELADYREIENARAELARAQRAFEEAGARAREAEADLRRVQARGLELSQRLAQLKGESQAADAECERALKDGRSLEAQAAGLEEQRRDADAMLARAQPDAEAHEAKLALLSEEAEGIKADLDRKRAEISPVRAEADRAAQDLSEAKVAHASASERLAYAKRMLQACDSDIRRAEEQSRRAKSGIARKEAALLRIDPVVSLLVRLADLARERVGALERQITRSQGRSDELNRAINASRAELSAEYGRRDAQAALLADIRVEKSRIELKVESAVSAVVDGCGVPLETALDIRLEEDRPILEEKAGKLRRKIKGMGAISPDAVEEYEQLRQRYEYLTSQLDDMLSARRSLTKIVGAIDARMRDDFARTFRVVSANFQEAFASLFPGGKGELALTDPDNLEETGVEVSAQPSGKRILKMTLMSGGEKSLTALALLFAVYKTRATPFYILDEVEAALDDTNLRRLVAYLDTLRNDSQFIVITHQRRTMEMADVLYGVSMQADGVTKVMSQRLDNALRYAEG